MTQCFEIEGTIRQRGCEVPRKDDCRSGGKRDLGGGETYTTYRIKVLVMCSALINPEASLKRIMYIQVSNKECTAAENKKLRNN